MCVCLCVLWCVCRYMCVFGISGMCVYMCVCLLCVCMQVYVCVCVSGVCGMCVCICVCVFMCSVLWKYCMRFDNIFPLGTFKTEFL